MAGAPQRRQSVTELPRLDPTVHAPQIALVRYLGEQDPYDFIDQQTCLQVMVNSVGNSGNGMNRLEHLTNEVGVLERQMTNGQAGKFFRLSEIGRQVLKRLPSEPKVSELRAKAREVQAKNSPNNTPSGGVLGTYVEARNELKRMGLRADGNKAEVFARLKAALDGGMTPPPTSPLKEPSTEIGPAGRKPGRSLA